MAMAGDAVRRHPLGRVARSHSSIAIWKRYGPGSLVENHRGKPWENHGKMVVEWDLMGFHGRVLPSGNDCYFANWKDPPSFTGKLHYEWPFFQSYVKDYQMVDPKMIEVELAELYL